MTPSELAERLNARAGGTPGQWMARCPSHRDRNPSLSIGAGEDGRVLLYCHAGCAVESIVAALDLSLADLMPVDEPGQHNGHNGYAPASRIAATYAYCDEDGTLLYQAVRYVPKGFKQRRPDGHGGWLWNLRDVTRVPYRFREIMQDLSGELWLFEGEKDADRAASLGLNATTTAGGAANFHLTANTQTIQRAAHGRRVYVVPDEDSVGRLRSSDRPLH